MSHRVEAPELAEGSRIRALVAAAPERVRDPAVLAALVGFMDLTSLAGDETADQARALCERAARPGPPERVPSCAAVCVYPALVGVCKQRLEGSGVRVASVAGGFPSGRAPLGSKLEEVRAALGAGADEIDTVIDHAAFLAGERERVFDELAAIKELVGGRLLKVILETGRLGAPEQVRAASELALGAGADFLKTSTGKTEPGATLAATLILIDAVADHHKRTGKKVGIKPAGGIRTALQACEYLLLLGSLGASWLEPSLFRLGASALLDDVLRALG